MKPLLLTAFALLTTATLSAADRPNILYIFTDDQSRRSVSAYEQAHPWATPLPR